MPTSEQGPQSGGPEQPAPEQGWQTYYQAARFADERQALATYVQVQGSLFRTPCDLSAYRVLLDNVLHVIVLGHQPTPDLDQQLHTLLAAGEFVALPRDAIDALQARRREASKHGPWVEGHYRTGKHIRRPER